MGTSVNQPSPNTPAWKIAQRAYDNPNLSTDWALREIWRAAGNQPEGDLAAQLAQPVIGDLASFAIRISSPADAAEEISTFVADNQVASLATDIARRAAMQSAGKEGASEMFMQRLFAEATNYLVSRDIPGHIAPTSRLQSISDVRAFKQQVMDAAATVVRNTPQPTSLQGDDWQHYVTTVIGTIKSLPR